MGVAIETQPPFNLVLRNRCKVAGVYELGQSLIRLVMAIGRLWLEIILLLSALGDGVAKWIP
jgi:hypothetical protein